MHDTLYTARNRVTHAVAAAGVVLASRGMMGGDGAQVYSLQHRAAEPGLLRVCLVSAQVLQASLDDDTVSIWFWCSVLPPNGLVGRCHRESACSSFEPRVTCDTRWTAPGLKTCKLRCLSDRVPRCVTHLEQSPVAERRWSKLWDSRFETHVRARVLP